jgi:hypothetical protein
MCCDDFCLQSFPFLDPILSDFEIESDNPNGTTVFFVYYLLKSECIPKFRDLYSRLRDKWPLAVM